MRQQLQPAQLPALPQQLLQLLSEEAIFLTSSYAEPDAVVASVVGIFAAVEGSYVGIAATQLVPFAASLQRRPRQLLVAVADVVADVA